MKKRLFIVMVAGVASIGGFLFGFDTGVISGALVFLQHPGGWGLSDMELGSVTTAVLLGAVIGSLVSGKITDWIGRKKIIIATSVIFMAGALLSGSAGNVGVLIQSRLFLGLGIGIASFSVPLYVAEISPTRNRGALVTINQLMITVGILTSYITDYLIADDQDPFSWRMMFHLGFIPGAILFIGMLFLPETPRWLVGKGKDIEGEKVLKKIEDPDLFESSLGKLKKEILASKEDGTINRQNFRRSLKYPIIIGIGIMLFSEITGIDTIIYYTPKIFRIAGYISNEQSLFPAIVVGVSNVLFTILSIFLVDKLGRRRLYFIGLSGLVTTLLLMGLCFHFQNNLGHLFSLFAIAAMFLFIGSFAVSFGPLSWLIISEIFPLKFRALGMSIGALTLWTSTTIVNYSFLRLVDKLTLAGTFWAFGFVGLVSGIWGYYFVPETKDKSLEYIEERWKEGRTPRTL